MIVNKNKYYMLYTINKKAIIAETNAELILNNI